MRYTQLIRFLLPLVVTVVVLELGEQVLNGGMARVPNATATLASYGLAWGLVSLLTSTLSQTKQLSLVLVDSHQSYQKVLWFVLIFGLIFAGILLSLALGPIGVWVIEDLHGIDARLGLTVREALLWLTPIPLLRALIFFHTGLLIRIRRTDIASAATISNIGGSILAVFILLPLSFVQNKPILLPLLVIYIGTLTELVIILWGYRRYVREQHRQQTDNATLSLAYILRFFWPLALIMAIQGMSRPLINLFISRGPDGAQALAVLTIVYSLGHLPYGWLNELRNLPPAFKDMRHSLPYIRKFAAACGLISLSIMFLLFWTPVRGFILENLIGVESNLATLSRVPLLIFTFFPIAVTIRAYLHGVGLLEHRTKAMAPSAPARIAAILAALTILPDLGVQGAALGVAALYAGFLCETATVWWGVRGRVVRQVAMVHHQQ